MIPDSVHNDLATSGNGVRPTVPGVDGPGQRLSSTESIESSDSEVRTLKRILLVLEAGSRLPSGIVRALVIVIFLAAHGFLAQFLVRQPLRLMDWINNLPSVLRLIVSRPWLKSRLLRWGTTVSERRILKLARDVDIVYLGKCFRTRLFKRYAVKRKPRVVYDFGDAVWLSNENQDEFNASEVWTW